MPPESADQRGYVLLWRRIWDSPFLRSSQPFTPREAWLYLFSNLANGIERNGLARGQFEASERFLARKFNWTKTAVHRFLANLQKEGMIAKLDHQTDQFMNRFTICNYELYQQPRTTFRTTKRTNIKEGIKADGVFDLKNDQKTIMSPASVELAETLKAAILKRDPKAKAARADTGKWATDIDKLLRLDKRTAEEIKAVIAWCQTPGNFWAPNILSGKKLRDKFDTLTGQMSRDQQQAKPKDDIHAQVQRICRKND